MPTLTIAYTTDAERLALEQAIAFVTQLHHLAATAPDGTVLDVCEQAALRDGRTLLKIPPGTQSGQKLRLREKGVPSATKEGARGDEIVEIKLTVPMPRDERSKEILRELAKLNPEDPRAELWKNV